MTAGTILTVCKMMKAKIKEEGKSAMFPLVLKKLRVAFQRKPSS